MQTFVPYPDFADSARVLDNRRLGKQRVETLQIMHALIDPEYGWQNHPAVRMWRGHEHALYDYQFATCREWTSRTSARTGKHFNDTCLDKTHALLDSGLQLATAIGPACVPPPWLGDPELHLSHRSNLLRKDPAHYGPLFPGDPDHLEYVWPV